MFNQLPTVSHSEQRLADALRDAGLQVHQQFPVQIRDYDNHYWIDIAILDRMVAIEVEGPHHAEPERHKRDISRRNYLQEKGWFVIQVHADDCSKERVRHTAKRVKEAVLSRAVVEHPPEAKRTGLGIKLLLALLGRSLEIALLIYYWILWSREGLTFLLVVLILVLFPIAIVIDGWVRREVLWRFR